MPIDIQQLLAMLKQQGGPQQITGGNRPMNRPQRPMNMPPLPGPPPEQSRKGYQMPAVDPRNVGIGPGNMSRAPMDDTRLAYRTQGPISPIKSEGALNASYENDMRGGNTFYEQLPLVKYLQALTGGGRLR